MQGVDQSMALRERLMKMEGLETALWVCSPLSRAIETMLYACPLDIEQLVARGQVQIRGEVTEFLQTTGDIGLPASNLRRKYPTLAPAMEDLPEVWWYGNLESNNPFKKQCQQFESKVRAVLLPTSNGHQPPRKSCYVLHPLHCLFTVQNTPFESISSPRLSTFL
jgi:broad specificity phosphatase PhoE